AAKLSSRTRRSKHPRAKAWAAPSEPKAGASLPRSGGSGRIRVSMSQLTLPFDSLEDAFVRAFREIQPRLSPPAFDIRFYPYANLDSKIRLEEGHRSIRVRLSDQLEHAPRAVQEALAHVLLSKLYRKPTPADQERA